MSYKEIKAPLQWNVNSFINRVNTGFASLIFQTCRFNRQQLGLGHSQVTRQTHYYREGSRTVWRETRLKKFKANVIPILKGLDQADLCISMKIYEIFVKIINIGKN